MPSILRDMAEVESFETFYRLGYRRMVAIARALVRDMASAEDLVQESFIAAHRNWDRISGYDDPQAWVRRVLINRATSFHRRTRAELRALARFGGRAETVVPDLSPQATEVWDEVRRLPKRQAQATVLHYVGQLSMEEVGEVMGCSAGAVKSHLHRARVRLGESLAEWEQESN